MNSKLNCKGFSLLEAVLAMTILAIGLVTGLSVLSNVVATSVDQEIHIIASQKASEQIEIILADRQFRGYDYVTTNNYHAEVLSGSYNLTKNVTITEVSSSDLVTPQINSGAKKVDVQVSWGTGAYQQVLLTTLVVDYE